MLETIVIVTSHFDSNLSNNSTTFLWIVVVKQNSNGKKYDVAEISTNIIIFRDCCRLPPIKLIKLTECYPPHTKFVVVVFIIFIETKKNRSFDTVNIKSYIVFGMRLVTLYTP